jgi:molybdopterin-containing oxidoreductase family membrane subunit
MSATPSDIAVSRGSPVLAAGHDYTTVTEKISSVVLKRDSGLPWRVAFAVALLLVMILTTAVSYLFLRGVGIWGIDIPVAWGFAIVNFVWWIGIGHAGTFISAMLYLMRQDWRTSINRFAEAMTLFAVACAGMFPLLHLGRPWEFFWLLPYPNTMWLWPQFRSPLVWDVFAVSTYGTISLVFWYVGLIPDLATIRDKSKPSWARTLYAWFALGWRGSARHWQRYQIAYLLLAGLAAPLVVSVHSVVGMDFAAAQLPGWHSTIFPPYFVAGAIFSGFAMVLTLAIPLRWAYGLQDFITIRHLENCAKLMLVTGLVVAYGYAAEAFYGWLSGNEFDMYMNVNRAAGNYRLTYYVLIFCNVISPQFLWFAFVRRSVWLLFIMALIVQLGMWMERFVIIITSLQRDFLPSSWGMYYPTIWDYATLFGTVGFFALCFLIFVRILPAISISEMRELVHKEAA